MSDRVPIAVPDDVVERWRGYLTAQQADDAWTRSWAVRKDHRRIARAQLLDFLARFLDGAVSLTEFQTTFDRKTRREWEGFGLKGLNGAMFLNKLVKHIPDQEALATEFRVAVRAPDGLDNGRRQLQGCLDYLNEVIGSKQATRGQLQPARAPYLLSAWWHQQAPERWPVSYQSARRVLEQDGLFRPNPGDLVRDYASFSATFSALSAALGLESWDLEGLCMWKVDRPTKSPSPRSTPTPTPIRTPETPDRHDTGAAPAATTLPTSDPRTLPFATSPKEPAEAGSPHPHAQWLLATIGHRLNCRVWVPPNDRNKTWNGNRVGDHSLDELPRLGIGVGAQKVIRWIDVLWLKGGNQVVAAFEIEHSRSIYSGLLRMSDLTALAPNLNFPLYIVAPETRLQDVRRELSRPTFQAIDLHERCGYFSIETLVRDAENIMRFATSPSAIDALAQRVEDVSDEDTQA